MYFINRFLLNMFSCYIMQNTSLRWTGRSRQRCDNPVSFGNFGSSNIVFSPPMDLIRADWTLTPSTQQTSPPFWCWLYLTVRGYRIFILLITLPPANGVWVLLDRYHFISLLSSSPYLAPISLIGQQCKDCGLFVSLPGTIKKLSTVFFFSRFLTTLPALLSNTQAYTHKKKKKKYKH